MNKLAVLICGVALLAVTGCAKTLLDVDMNDFSALAEFDSINFARIAPAQSHRYWELRYTFGPGGGVDNTLASGGTNQRGELDATTLQALDAAIPPAGFTHSCLPGHCYLFILTVSPNGAVGVVDTRVKLRDFLGEIDNLEEAALILRSYNMYWSRSNDDTGFRAVGGGWEFLALELVRDCTPVQTDRVHTLVRRDGSLAELGREVHSKLEGACI